MLKGKREGKGAFVWGLLHATVISPKILPVMEKQHQEGSSKTLAGFNYQIFIFQINLTSSNPHRKSIT